MNLKVRIKNPYFWIGIIGVILTASGTAPETLTSWPAVLEWGKALVGNPYALIGSIIAVVGVCHDPTTQGIQDSKQVQEYDRPRKHKKKEKKKQKKQ